MLGENRETVPWPQTREWSCFLLPFQVYVRRAYIAYELNSLQHRQLLDGTCVVEFQFMLPSSHPNRWGKCP